MDYCLNKDQDKNFKTFILTFTKILQEIDPNRLKIQSLVVIISH